MADVHGFIKLSRSITACGWFRDNNTLAVLVRLTLLAEWQTAESRGVELKRGQLIATIPQIAELSQLTVQQTRTILDRLKSTGRITVRSTPKFSIITLNDYDGNCEFNSHDSRQTPENQQTEQPEFNRPSLLYKENKNTRREERADGTVSEILSEAVREYSDICKSLPPLIGELTYQQGRLVIEADKELHGVSFAEYFRRVENSDFLTGKSSGGFMADFNWLMRPENVAKVLSGRYDRNYRNNKSNTTKAADERVYNADDLFG